MIQGDETEFETPRISAGVAESSPGYSIFPMQLAAIVPGRQQINGVKYQVPATPGGNLDGVPSFQLQPGLAQAVMDILGMKQQTEDHDFCVSPSAFQIYNL